MKKIIFLIVFTLPLSVIESKEPIVDKVEDSKIQVGRITIKKQNIFAFFGFKKKPAYIGKIYKINHVKPIEENGKLSFKTISKIKINKKNRHSIDLEPGYYEVTAKCSNPDRGVKPSSIIKVEAGLQKELFCTHKSVVKKKFGINIGKMMAILSVKEVSQIENIQP